MKKTFKKLMALAVAMLMLLAMAVPAIAQTVSGAGGGGSITIKNAAKGETYSVHMLFEATVGSNNEIAYKMPEGGIPESLQTYFEETTLGSGYVKAKDSALTEKGEMSDGLRSALTAWATDANKTLEAESNGSALTFDDLTLGYYVVKTSQGDQLISVDSTKKAAEIIDKNTTEPNAMKEVDGTSYSIGDTITYTGTFNTTNYIGEEQVKSYTISDTLPEFLSNVKITGVKIIQSATPDTNNPDVDLSSSYTTFTDKKILIPWVDTDGTTNLYKNGSKIKITYTAELTSTVNVNADNTNIIKITPNKDKDGKESFEDVYKDDAKITTYAAALKKVDDKGSPLSGAKFAFKGLNTVETAAGIYMVTGYNTTSAELGTEMEVDENGMLYIIGLKEDIVLEGNETAAPDGYNKLTEEISVPVQKLTEEVFHTEGKRYYDADGNLVKEESSSTSNKDVKKNLSELDAQAFEVENKQGTVLPSTGGMGTTIFYIIGGILVAAAVIVLVAKKKVQQ